MAQAVVSSVVNKLSHHLQEEASCLNGLLDEFQWMERELRGLLVFLKDADSKQRHDGVIRTWVRDVREAAYEAEETVDSFLLRATRFPHYFSSAHARRQICKKIIDIRQRIDDIMARRVKYGLVSVLDGQGLEEVRRFVEHVNDDTNVIGFEEEKKMIIDQVLEPVDRLCVVAIVGVKGLGKTTLAKTVYDSIDIKEQFDARAWISITSTCSSIDVLKKTIKELCASPKKIKEDVLSDRSKRIINEIKDDQSNLAWKEEDIQGALQELLKAKGRCLVAMDDVWRKELWEKIQTAFLMTENSSRVILTTHSMEITDSMDPYTIPYALRTLDQHESKLLFLNKIYPNDQVVTFRDDLEEVGQEIVTRCRGLPLSLVLLGGLLSTKEKSYRVWSDVLANLEALETSEKREECRDILTVCFDDLPLDLKACFIYMGIFAEGSEIRAGQLVRLWMAESLISKRGKRASEEVADIFLEELIQRCMVDVAQRKYNGKAAKIRIHGLLRDLCTSEAKENGFVNVEISIADGTSSSSAASTATLRLGFHSAIPEDYVDPRSAGLKSPSLRTIIGISLSKLEHRFGEHLSGLKLLTVIDVEGERRLTTIPVEVSNMIHLRYLRWIVKHSKCGVKSLPNLRNLRHLQTLDTNAEISNDDGIDSLKNLRCLIHVKGGRDMGRQLLKFANLRRLKISISEPVLVNSFEKQRSLESFSLQCQDGFVQPEVFTVFPALRKFKLHGKLSEQQNKLPPSSLFPKGLTKLSLESCGLQKDPLEALERLPNLKILTLGQCSYAGKSMNCTDGGFPQLQIIAVKRLERLEEWVVGTGAMVRLESLTMEGCRRLRMIPEGLQHITTLKEIKILNMDSTIKRSILRVPAANIVIE